MGIVLREEVGSGLDTEWDVWVGYLGSWRHKSRASFPLIRDPSVSLMGHQQFEAPSPRVQSQCPSSACPHSLMHLFMSGFRASKYPGGQDGKQTPTWRMSFRSSRMKSLGEHLRQPLTSEQSSQPLAQAWLPSALTARTSKGEKAAVGEPSSFRAPTETGGG